MLSYNGGYSSLDIIFEVDELNNIFDFVEVLLSKVVGRSLESVFEEKEDDDDETDKHRADEDDDRSDPEIREVYI